MRCQIKNIIYKNLYYMKTIYMLIWRGGLGGQLAPPTNEQYSISKEIEEKK